MNLSKPTSEAIEKWRLEPFTSFATILEDSSEGQTLIGKAIKSMLASPNDDYNNSDGRKLAQQVISENIKPEINLYAMFLIVWAVTSSKGLNLTESNLILKKLEELDQKMLYPETQATILATIGYCEAVSGNKMIRIKYLQDALQVKNLNDIHKVKLISGLNGALQSLGLLKDLENLLTEPLKKSKIYYDETEKTISLLSNAIQLCQFQLANKLFKEIKSDPEKLKIFLDPANQYDIDEIYFRFIENPKTYPFTKNAIDDSSLKYYEKWITATGYLFTGDAQSALIWSRKYASEHPIGMRNRNLQSFTLIRSEIANKNSEAAKKLMHIKINQGYPHFLDNFFFARIALLDDKKDIALTYIKQLHQACTYYDAFGRLDFELALACELLTNDLSLFLYTPIEVDNELKSNNSFTPIIQNIKNTEELMGESNIIKSIKEQITKFAAKGGIILLQGETGVGKEIVANAIHLSSTQKEKPFIPINCGSISESLLQSELFGHTAGAFTGAYKYQKGVFEAAENGTVFLDEIGEISPLVQIALLRVLEKREIRPIGSTTTKKINCNIIAATNKKLEDLVAKGNFREDLFYRLNQLFIFIPPLRDRANDVILLANHFFSQNRSDGKSPVMSEELKQLFKKFDWPGNVRQLKNEIEKMRLLNSEKLFYEKEDFTLNVNIKLDSTKKNMPAQEKLPNYTLQLIINSEKTPFRRKEKIIELFKEAGALTRGEIIKLLKISPGTATSDLYLLEEQGYIRRITPSASTRTHYFEYCKIDLQ